MTQPTLVSLVPELDLLITKAQELETKFRSTNPDLADIAHALFVLFQAIKDGAIFARDNRTE